VRHVPPLELANGLGVRLPADVDAVPARRAVARGLEHEGHRCRRRRLWLQFAGFHRDQSVVPGHCTSVRCPMVSSLGLLLHASGPRAMKQAACCQSAPR